VVEKALQARLQKEKARKRWLEGKREWEGGASDGRFVRRELESFMLQDEHWLGLLSKEYFAALEESWKGVSRE
jgi:hypothetical protein